YAKVDELEVGGLSLRNQVVAVDDFSDAIAIDGKSKLEGVIGYEVIQRFPTVIDYERHEVTFVRPDKFEPPKLAKPIPFQFGEWSWLVMPIIHGEVDGEAIRALIDTGSFHSLLENGPFVERHHLLKKYRPKFALTVSQTTMGPVRAAVTRVADFR